MNDGAVVSTDRLVKVFHVGRSELVALKEVSLEFRRGEFSGLVGPSGSGKTTLLNIIGTLDAPTSGSATVLGERVEKLSPVQAASLRSRQIGFIFQTFNLLPVYTAYENVEFPLLLLGMGPAERRNAVMAALEWVGLADRAGSRPNQLSGGESQRVAIARAVVKRPELVLADEPTANLDAENSHKIFVHLRRLTQREVIAVPVIIDLHPIDRPQIVDPCAQVRFKPQVVESRLLECLSENSFV
jgi:putative ABC transport system ATP-binding protein